MSNKSGTSPQVISIPKGGGALKGIGESFSPDLHTGTGNFTVPIALPPGRNGFQPQLNLVYSTGSGNSPYGLGWNVGIPVVSRKTSKGIPRYDDTRDVFLLSGAEDLVPVHGAPPGATRYRPRTEGIFALIDHYQDAKTNHWVVCSKDGYVSLYGTPETVGTGDTAVVADPRLPAKIFAWKLTSTTDPFGNRIEYTYQRDAARHDGPHRWDQLYLSEIRYAEYGDLSHPQYLMTVRFTYDDRPDPFSEYRAGFEIRTVRRCTRIDIATHPGVEIPVRTYHLVYTDQQDAPGGKLPLNGVSLLGEIRVEGHDGDQSESLPPLSFGYIRFEPEGRDFFPVTGPDLPPGSLGRPEYEVADVIGNGLPDIVEMSGTVRYWRNLGNGRFDRPREMTDAPAGLHLASPGVQLLDANGDGRIDLMVTTPELAGYYSLGFAGLWDRRSFQRYTAAPSFNLEDPEVRLVDLNGDGVTDAIRSGRRFECFFNHPKEGWRESRWVERQALPEFPNINFSDPRVKWADMTGDGLQDIVLVYDGNIEYWPALGYGEWAPRVSMRNCPRFAYGYGPRRILVGDVDGDGLADLIYVDDTKVTLWINQSGNCWSEPIEIHGTPPVSDMDAVRLVDLLGTGVSGLLWSFDASSRTREHLFFLDFTGGRKPYLLDEMDNHLGATTKVRYSPSTYFYLADQDRAETLWNSPLPFPVQVVSTVEVIDHLSRGKLTTEYRYHHGYWDGAEREFRGFGRVDQRDSERFADYHGSGLHGADQAFEAVPGRRFSPPTETRTWFHQGPVGDEFGEWEEPDFAAEFWTGDPPVFTGEHGRPRPMQSLLKALPRRVKRDALRTLRGRILRTELYALDGTERENRPYTVTESLHGVCAVSDRSTEPGLICDSQGLPVDWVVDAGAQRIFFPHTLAQRTTQWERGNDPMTRFSFTEDYDPYGQPRRQTAIACPRGWRQLEDLPGEPFLATRTVSVYAQAEDPKTYIVDRVAKTTSYEFTNGGDRLLFGLEELADDDPTLQVIGQTLNYYDGEAFTGLPNGRVGSYGALARSESLILTEEILREAYGGEDPVHDTSEIPPYLVSGEQPVWPQEYPEGFRALPPLAGYLFYEGDAEHARGYYATTVRNAYDIHGADPANGRGLLRTTRDPLGRDTHIGYDDFDLLPTRVTDPLALTTQASYDYRILQPSQVTDPNGNRTAYGFTALGFLAWTAVMGKESEALGDTREVPSTRLEYDFLAFVNSPPQDREPISVGAVRRVHHVHDLDAAEPERNETIHSVEYSDGFGRLLQTRTQAEDLTFGDPVFGNAVLPADQGDTESTSHPVIGEQHAVGAPDNVIVSGWQVYDNKGRVVEKYEPFFSRGWDYAAPTEEERGQKVRLFYDPRGQLIRTVNPDDSEQRVIYGVPIALEQPDVFGPTPWEAFTYDVNDNAGRTHPDQSRGYRDHWDTPSSVLVDALGRTLEAVERNRAKPQTPAAPLPAIEEYRTRSSYDIRGNLLTVTDAKDRRAFTYAYDLANNPLRTESIDAGIRRTVLNVVGSEIERRDSKGALILSGYDLLDRPSRLWTRDDVESPITLRERLEYGDGGRPDQPVSERDKARASNHLGRLAGHYDEAGVLRVVAYDFKGNLLEKQRRVIADEAILAVFQLPRRHGRVPAFRVDWEPPAGGAWAEHVEGLLDPREYRTSITYDALNRIRTLDYPEDRDGERKRMQPHYNRAGALERVVVAGTTYVEMIAYNARGQRTLIVYGNGVMTRHAYEPQTFRLLRLRAERCAVQTPLGYRPIGLPLQDFSYWYDLAGNIIAIRDRSPESGIPNTSLGVNALDRRFAYDSLYRLLSATGRECDRPPELPWDGRPRSTDLQRTRSYSEQYGYDEVGNLRHLGHQANGAGFSRLLDPEATSNRLKAMTVGQTGWDYRYDANGNLLQENASRHFEWDHSDRMRVYCTQAGNAAPTVHAHYLYDAAGQRVKKLVRKTEGRIEATVYIDGIFEHSWLIRGRDRIENNVLRVM